MSLKCDPKIDVNGTHFLGYFRATYNELLDAFGEHGIGDSYKVSTEWTFDLDGKPFTLYDYKETFLYEKGLPSVEEFRSDPNPKLWHIGGLDKEYYEFFTRALAKELKAKEEENEGLERKHKKFLNELAICVGNHRDELIPQEVCGALLCTLFAILESYHKGDAKKWINEQLEEITRNT